MFWLWAFRVRSGTAVGSKPVFTVFCSRRLRTVRARESFVDSVRGGEICKMLHCYMLSILLTYSQYCALYFAVDLRFDLPHKGPTAARSDGQACTSEQAARSSSCQGDQATEGKLSTATVTVPIDAFAFAFCTFTGCDAGRSEEGIA